jgi:hypothetical protein
MDKMFKEITWRQFGAAIDMFENAIKACLDEFWSASMWTDPSMGAGFSEFWYVSYHTLFWLDLYLGGAVQGFHPPAPFTLAELDPAGLLPDRTYTRAELLAYLAHCRRKCRTTISALTDEKARHLCSFTWGQVSFAELLLDNMRHVQEHAAQLSMFLGQKAGENARWLGQAREDLDDH